MPFDKETEVNLLKAALMCMDYPMSQMDDDKEYNDAVDVQNQLRGKLRELTGEG